MLCVSNMQRGFLKQWLNKVRGMTRDIIVLYFYFDFLFLIQFSFYISDNHLKKVLSLRGYSHHKAYPCEQQLYSGQLHR